MADHGEYREEIHGEHPHSYDHAEPRYGQIAILGGLTVVLLIVVGIGLQVYYQNVYERQTYEKVLSQDNIQLQELRRKETWELENYAIIDKAKGSVRLPIREAMRLVAQEAAENRLKYPTNPYPVKTEAQSTASPAVSQSGAAAANAAQNQGVTTSPNAQQSTVPQQPRK